MHDCLEQMTMANKNWQSFYVCGEQGRSHMTFKVRRMFRWQNVHENSITAFSSPQPCHPVSFYALPWPSLVWCCSCCILPFKVHKISNLSKSIGLLLKFLNLSAMAWCISWKIFGKFYRYSSFLKKLELCHWSPSPLHQILVNVIFVCFGTFKRKSGAVLRWSIGFQPQFESCC